METVFSIIYVLLQLRTLHYTTIYTSRQPRACIYSCLSCQKFTVSVSAAANLYCQLLIVLVDCFLQQAFFTINSIHIIIAVAQIFPFAEVTLECSICLTYQSRQLFETTRQVDWYWFSSTRYYFGKFIE